MSARDRLAALLAPDVLDALEELVAERVAAELAGSGPNESRAPWLSIQEAAVHARVSERSLERAIAAGRLRSSTFGRRRLVHRDDLDEYLRGNAKQRRRGRRSASHSTPPPRRV